MAWMPAPHRESLAAELVRAVPHVMRELQAAPSLARLWAIAPAALCEAGGFDRGAPYSLRRGRVWIESAYFAREPEWAARFVSLTRAAAPTLRDFRTEAELLRRGEAGIVRPGARASRSYRSIIREARAGDYVAAPLVVESHRIGFVAFDAYASGRRVAREDLERAAALAELLSAAVARRLLLDRLAQVRAAVPEALEELERDGPGAPRSVLSEREREVVRLVGRGMTNGEIAEALGISLPTVKTHLSRAFRKLGVRSRAEAVATGAA